MKIAIYGAGGNIGGRIAQEALNRGHQVTAIVRDPARLTLSHPGLTAVIGDVLDPASLASSVAGHDAVVSAISPPTDLKVNIASLLINGLTTVGVKRLVVVGGAGSLEVAPGVQLVDTPDFPAAWKGIAGWHRDQLGVYRQNETLDWSFFSPAAFIEPGKRTGTYRIGQNQLLTDAQGESRISYEDYAVALVDELENPKNIRKQFTVAY